MFKERLPFLEAHCIETNRCRHHLIWLGGTPLLEEFSSTSGSYISKHFEDHTRFHLSVCSLGKGLSNFHNKAEHGKFSVSEKRSLFFLSFLQIFWV